MFTPELISLCQKQDRRAQRELYEMVYPLLIKVSRRYASNEEDVQEIVTNSFLKILNHLDQVTKEFPAAWIKTIGVNTAIDAFRKNKKYKETFKLNADYSYNAIENIHIDINTVDMEMECEYIFTMIQALPPTTKQVLNLFAIDGYKHEEICEILGITHEMSRWHLHKARKLLQEQLQSLQVQTMKSKKSGNK